MNPPKQIQINCPYFRGVVVNGRQYYGCIGMRELIAPENANDFCFGAKCTLPLLNSNEAKA